MEYEVVVSGDETSSVADVVGWIVDVKSSVLVLLVVVTTVELVLVPIKLQLKLPKLPQELFVQVTILLVPCIL